MMMRNALDAIINLSGIEVTIKRQSDLSSNTVVAAQSNYFRRPLVDESIVGVGREYVVSVSSTPFLPKRGDTFIVSSTEFYSIIEVKEMRAFKEIIGYRMTLE